MNTEILLLGRLRQRLKEDFDNKVIDIDTLKDYITTSIDRINLRLGTDSLPDEFKSVVVEIVIKMHRRCYHEGISSESVDSLSTSFVDDILDEFSTEFEMYKKTHINNRQVRFL